METIKLSWMIKIRERINEYIDLVNDNNLKTNDLKANDLQVIKEFIRPIIKYGEKEEIRITEAFDEDIKRRKENGTNTNRY